MDAKLTLKLDQQVIEKAKKYASQRKLSLSKMIENYLDSVTGENTEEIEITPFVKSLSSSTSLPADYDYKQDQGYHLAQKYK